MADSPLPTRSGAPLTFDEWWAKERLKPLDEYDFMGIAQAAWDYREEEIRRLRHTLNYVVPALDAVIDAEKMVAVRRVAVTEALK